MTRLEHLFACLIEECAEVSQRATKALRFGALEVQPGQRKHNITRLSEEFNDLLAVAQMVNEYHNGLIPDQKHIDKKKRKILKYMRYAREKGALE